MNPEVKDIYIYLLSKPYTPISQIVDYCCANWAGTFRYTIAKYAKGKKTAKERNNGRFSKDSVYGDVDQ